MLRLDDILNSAPTIQNALFRSSSVEQAAVRLEFLGQELQNTRALDLTLPLNDFEN